MYNDYLWYDIFQATAMPYINVCLTPSLIHQYSIGNNVVIIADIFRATSCMVTALAHGATCIIPTTQLTACKQMKAEGHIIGCEKNGQKVAGFDKGNSPFEYMGEDIKGATIALKTTNGTKAIELSKQAPTVLIGAFLNLTSVINYVRAKAHNVLVFCAGWRGEVSIEDTLFAGAVVDALLPYTTLQCDAPVMAQKMYLSAKNDMHSFLKDASHFQRLSRLGYAKDITFCLKNDQYPIVPLLKGNKVVL